MGPVRIVYHPVHRGHLRTGAIPAAARAVPALVFAGVAPANAAVANPIVTITTQATAIVGERVSFSVKVMSNGTPAAGESVTLTVDSITTATFGAASKSVTSKTDASGVFENTTALNIRKAGTVIVTATSNGVSSTSSIYIEPSTGTLAWDDAKLTVAPNSELTARVKVTRLTGTVNPSRVTISYTGDVTGPQSVVVTSGLAATLKDVKVGPNGGTITAVSSTGGFGSAMLTLATR